MPQPVDAGTLRPLLLATEAHPEWSDVQAAEGAPALRKFTMLAYGGGPLRLEGYYRPVVIDLAGMRAAAKDLPILRGHDDDRIVGHGQAEITAQRVTAAGVISGAGDAAREVAESSRNGFPWQASVGAVPVEMQLLREGETATVNGRPVRGPAYIARKTVLREISFVPRGADSRTSAKVTASARKDHAMDFTAWLQAMGFEPDQLSETQKDGLTAKWQAEQKPADPPPGPPAPPVKAAAKGDDDPQEPDPIAEMRAAAAAERKRIAAVGKACEGKHPEIEAKAIEEGWSAEKTELAVLRASRPTAPAGFVHGPDLSVPVLEAACCLSGGIQDPETHYNEQTLEAAHKQFRKGISIKELLIIQARAHGYSGMGIDSVRHDLEGVLKAAFSNNSTPGILSGVANKFLLESFLFVEQAWRQIAARKPVSDFKQITSYRLTGNMQFDQVGPDGQLKHGALGEESFSNQADTYGKIFSLTRKQIINDDLGAYSAVPRLIGRGSALKLNNVFWTKFLDNAAFFTAGNNNYISGAGTVLSIDALTQAEQTFMDQTDPDGFPLAIAPKLLLVPTALSTKAAQFTRDTDIRDTTASKVYSTSNPHAGKWTPVVSAYPGNASFTGNSATGWYLLADPNDLPVIDVCFLNGVEEPTVESADADFDTLGIVFRGFFDFGVDLQDHRGGVKSKGAA